MRRILLAGLLLAGISMARPANAQDTVKVFVGYSFANVPFSVVSGGQVPILPTPGCTGTGVTCAQGALFNQFAANSSGWELSGTVKAYKWLGIAADFDGHYSGSGGSAIHRHSFAFGPEVALPGRFSPFAHVLVGATHESVGLSTGNAFATAVGGGVDIKAGHRLSIRLIQADYFMSHFNGFSRNNYRISTGIVLHF